MTLSAVSRPARLWAVSGVGSWFESIMVSGTPAAPPLTAEPDIELQQPAAALEKPDLQVEPSSETKDSYPPFEDDPANCRNWSSKRKWINTIVISITGFLSTSGSSMFVPAGPLAGREFGETNQQVITLATALYVMGLGFGPFVFAPIAELWGRQIGYATSMIGCTLFSMGSALSPNMRTLIVLRFICGFFASSGPSLGLATVSDLFAPSERGKPASVYAIGPMLGPVVGTILGNYLVLSGSFRWVLGFLTIALALNTAAICLLMRETYGPVVERKLKAQRNNLPPGKWGLPAWVYDADVKAVFVRTCTRPPRMLRNPVVALFSVYYAYIYAVIYVLLVAFPLLFNKEQAHPGLFNYGWPSGTVGLCYIGLGVGFMTSAITAAFGQDRIYRFMTRRNGGAGQPEYRLILTQLGMLIFPSGLLVFGWTAQAQKPWILPEIGVAITGYGLMLGFNSIQVFLVDAFFPYSAAALAVASFLRSVCGCLLPIFSPDLFVNLQWGVGATLLAAVSLPAVPAPFVLFKYGEALRKRHVFTT